MPVFTKRLLCSRSNSRADGRRSGCRGSSSSDDDDVNGPPDNKNTDNGQPRCRNNAEVEARGRQSSRRDDDDGFRFLLTVANIEANSDTVLEFEHANMGQGSSSLTEEPAPRQPSKKVPKKAAKSSCGRASSNEEESSMEDEPPTVQPKAKEDAADFLVLLTGLLAHGPPPPDDFRFLLTVHQSEAAT